MRSSHYPVDLVQPDSRDKGFTLIEVLGAAVIYGLVLGVLWMTLGTAVSALQRVKGGSKSQSTLLAVYNRLGNDLAGAMVPSIDGKPRFKGHDQGLQLTTRMMIGGASTSPEGELKTLVYRWEAPQIGKNQGRLLRTTYTGWVDEPAGMSGDTQAILEVPKVTFEYYDTRGQRWVQAWDSTESLELPSLVRVNVDPEATPQRTPIHLVVAVQAGRRYSGVPVP